MSSKYLPDSIIRLEHWQNPETNRTGYLRGLALDCYEHPDSDRNSHYFGRDLLWAGRPRSAIKEFTRHINMHQWPAERAQSMIYIGDAHLQLGEEEAALQSYHRAFITDATRREALIRLAEFCLGKSDWQRAAAYARAALTIAWNSFYANRMEHYEHVPHELLYQALWWLGDKEGSKLHWEKALEYQPLNSKYLHHARFYHEFPKVSIVIPTLGREEQLKKLVELLENNDYVNHPNYEVIVQADNFGTRAGVAATLKKGIERATGELICFLGNDCIPQRDFLIHAAMTMLKGPALPPDRANNAVATMPQWWSGRLGLVALNDGLWNGTLATHWLASKSLLSLLDGEFFHTGYHHVGCDNELTARVKKMGCYAYCPEAKISHPRAGEVQDHVSKIAWDPDMVNSDRELLRKRSEKLGFELI